MIRVVNKYAGVPSGGHHEYIGRPSVLGNPYRIGIDGDRAQVIQKFRRRLDTTDEQMVSCTGAGDIQ